MSERAQGQVYRVIAVRDNGTKLFVQGNLARPVAESIRATLLGVFPHVLIEDDESPLQGRDETRSL